MKLSPHLSLFISQLRPYQPRSVPRLALLRPLSYHTHRFRNSNLAIAQAKRTPYLPTRNSSTIPTPTQSDQNINTIGQPGDGHIGNSTQTSNGKTPHEPSYTQATSNAHEPNSASSSKSLNIERSQPPSYRLFFTCKPCGSREGHIITKHGYHRGTILITCSKCKNRHIISDHLKIFSDVSVTIEDMMREKGELVKRGSIAGNGDIEFWTDESEQQPPKTQKEKEDAVLRLMEGEVSSY